MYLEIKILCHSINIYKWENWVKTHFQFSYIAHWERPCLCDNVFLPLKITIQGFGLFFIFFNFRSWKGWVVYLWVWFLFWFFSILSFGCNYSGRKILCSRSKSVPARTWFWNITVVLCTGDRRSLGYASHHQVSLPNTRCAHLDIPLGSLNHSSLQTH